MTRARWRGLEKVLMQVLPTATILNIKKLLAAVIRRARAAASAVKSASFLCLEFMLDVFYWLKVRYQDQEYIEIKCFSGLAKPFGLGIAEVK
jgi:hypothetical protein